MRFLKQILCLLFVQFLTTQIDGIRPKRMFALCPPHFERIGNECYFISQNRVNWLDAHFECKDRDSRLAEPFKQEDRFLRKYLNHLIGPRPADLWIGARFNWERNKWQWGHNGNDLTYQSFSQMSADNKDLKFHCAILKPNLKYRWSASSCEVQHQYICQHRMPYVNEKNRQKIYNKWNETYPNEMANEIEVVLSEDDLLRRRRKMHRSHLKSQQNNRQIKDHRRRNHIPLNDLRAQDPQQPNPWRKLRIGNKHPKPHDRNQQFDLSRSRGSGIRQPIHFNNTGDSHKWQLHQTRRQKQKWNAKSMSTTTHSPTTWEMYNPSSTARTMTKLPPTPTLAPIIIPRTTTTAIPTPTTSTTGPTTTTRAPANWLSNDVNMNNDEEQMRKRYEEIEQKQYEDEQRRQQEYMDKVRRIEDERLQNEERIRAEHLKALERRQQELINEQKQQLENDRIREQKKQQDAERRRQNEMNKISYETAQNQQAELIQQRNQQANHDEHAIQTNEILDNVSSTMSTIDKKRTKNKRLRDRLSKLTVEQQILFFQKRAERHKKRGAPAETETDSPYSD